MRPFAYSRATGAVEAVRAAGPDSMYHAGGTTLVDLMILDVWRPDRLIDISDLDGDRFRGVRRDGAGCVSAR